MARLAIDKDFLDDYSKLPKPVQNSVKTAIDKFAEHVHAGLHLEKITRCKDDRIRTIRIDQSWRGVVFAPETGDTYCLLKVLPHDKAIAYAGSHRFTVNEALGVVEVRNETALEQIQPSLERAAGTTSERLFADVSDADMTRLGIDENTRTIARLLTSEAHLDAMQHMIPDAQYAVLAARLPRRSGQKSRSMRRSSRSIPATSSQPWNVPPAVSFSSRGTTNSTASLSTRSQPGASSSIRRSGRSPIRHGTQGQLRSPAAPAPARR
jgi:hypothetical protein